MFLSVGAWPRRHAVRLEVRAAPRVGKFTIVYRRRCEIAHVAKRDGCRNPSVSEALETKGTSLWRRHLNSVALA